jgi:hypothetical protein
MLLPLKKLCFGKDIKLFSKMQIGNFSFEILNLTFEAKNVKYFLEIHFSYTLNNGIHSFVKLILYANNANLFKKQYGQRDKSPYYWLFYVIPFTEW